MADYNSFKKSAIRADDEIVSCPYNPSHQILKSRMQYHIVKCQKQHALKELVTCPFNVTHRIPKPELSMHVLECPDKRILETHKYQTVDESTVNKNNPPGFLRPSLPPSEEDWDSVDYQSSYDPNQHINNRCVLRNIQGATKSERKHFRLEERRRVNQLCTDTPQPEASNVGYVPARLPKSLPKGVMNSELGTRLGMGRGVAPSMGPSVAPGMGPSVAPSMGRGVAPSMGPSVAPGMGRGVALGMGRGVAPDMGHNLSPSK